MQPLPLAVKHVDQWGQLIEALSIALRKSEESPRPLVLSMQLVSNPLGIKPATYITT